MRLFFGVPLDAAARRAIAEWTSRWRREYPEIRWTADETLHVTLAFLGEVADAWVEEIVKRSDDALRGILSAPNEIPKPFALARPGFFLHPPRVVLWLGAEDPGWIAACARAIGRALAALSPEADRDSRRPFTAHVTLARPRFPHRDRARFDRFLEDYRAAPPPAAGPQAARVVLFRSALKPEGAEHTPLRIWEPGAGMRVTDQS